MDVESPACGHNTSAPGGTGRSLPHARWRRSSFGAYQTMRLMFADKPGCQRDEGTGMMAMIMCAALGGMGLPTLQIRTMRFILHSSWSVPFSHRMGGRRLDGAQQRFEDRHHRHHHDKHGGKSLGQSGRDGAHGRNVAAPWPRILLRGWGGIGIVHSSAYPQQVVYRRSDAPSQPTAIHLSFCDVTRPCKIEPFRISTISSESRCTSTPSARIWITRCTWCWTAPCPSSATG